VMAGISRILDEHGIAPGEVDAVIHGTTLVANALIMEGEGPRTHNLRGFEIATWEPEP
ncbi:MAG TPA: hypothetical protein EYP19_06570, partial [Desulfobacterales bacterium]|nr:hypothetical protein [Desulfobacterales bacterium]